jgi:hypothetical protein
MFMFLKVNKGYTTGMLLCSTFTFLFIIQDIHLLKRNAYPLASKRYLKTNKEKLG